MVSRRQLPPLNALAVFEAAARLGNFSRAGVELGLTQSAVSRQIGKLEAFIGSLAQQGQWTCPSWFPSTICANASRVAQGIRSFEPVSTAVIREDLIVTKTGNHEQMYDYWVGQHVCPWYQTFDEALAANPFPLPFNGTNWPGQDCVFAP